MSKKSMTAKLDAAFEKAGLVEVGRVGGTKILGTVRPARSAGGNTITDEQAETESFAFTDDKDAPPHSGEAKPTGEATQTVETGAGQLRTQEDRWREHIGQRITEAYMELDKLNDDLADKEQELSDCRADVSDVKAEISGINAKLKSYAGQMRDIQAGTFSPPLFDKHTGEVLARPKSAKSVAGLPADPGQTYKLAQLVVNFGLSASDLDKLEESQLAKSHPLKTVADLERAIAGDEWWYRQVKGFGLSKVDHLIDVLTAFRLQYPVPQEADDRVKRCINSDCYEQPGSGIFEPREDGVEACPNCGKTFFELVVQHPLNTIAAATEAIDSEEE